MIIIFIVCNVHFTCAYDQMHNKKKEYNKIKYKCKIKI